MKKVFYLGNCSTCKRIISELNPEEKDFLMREIKSDPISEAELDHMKHLSGSYESLFSRRAMKYKSMGLNEMDLSEKEYRKYILEEYTFLKRPVLVTDDAIFVGSSKKIVESAKKYISEL